MIALREYGVDAEADDAERGRWLEDVPQQQRHVRLHLARRPEQEH